MKSRFLFSTASHTEKPGLPPMQAPGIDPIDIDGGGPSRSVVGQKSSVATWVAGRGICEDGRRS